ncbi:hypothetical protein N7519_001007 [Penicillium mononematosum]|uniref:uncharacterized protein n=1 Tax=Penicillium mononematosum TaxID=268346 RepID=UPI00254772D4|nr:uncharacterized protein N7519_001007 [Penicillium mononematosum]KAJ6190986.1 hypothetical protein N7519_001007 [Penicillium mononematosum]
MASSGHYYPALFGALCCPLCKTEGRTYRQLSSLNDHLEEGHGVLEWGYRCLEPDCTFTAPRKKAMIEHWPRVHRIPGVYLRPERNIRIIQLPCPTACEICSQPTVTWNDFYQHAKNHCIGNNLSEEVPGVDDGYSSAQLGRRDKRADEDKYTTCEVKPPMVHPGNAILSHGVDKKPDHSSAPGGTEPQDTIVHEPRQFSLSRGSGSSATHSVATNITTPESEEDSIDAGILDTKNMDHILDAGRYFSDLDQLELQTAQILGMLNGTGIKLESLDDCIECLGNWQAALEYLQSQGFCENTVSILIEDQDRDGVASVFHISLSQVGALLQTILSTLEEDALKRLAMTWMQTMLNLDNKALSDCDSVEILRYLCRILFIGIVAFSGSHVCRFDINLWDQEMEEIPVGFDGYAFKPRKLACLDDFIGGPAWILGKVSAPPEGMKISLTVQDVQELWGPVSLVEGTAEEAPIIQTERGFIVPFQYSNSLPYISDESLHMKILISSRSRILIGTSTDVKPGLVVNDKCRSSISSIGQQIACRLQYPGTSKSRYVSDGYDVQLVGGQYVTAGLVKKYKRIPKRTLKAMLIADCTKPDTRLVPLLKLRVGLEVSACTGNAQRVTLWDALRFSQTSTQDTDHPTYCAHNIGDKNCISSCWTRWSSVDDIDSLDHIPAQNKLLSGLEARRVIVNSILALEHSGIDGEGNLQVSWPFSNSPANCPVLPSTPKESHNWFRVVKDTRDTSSFAVFSQRCLELPEKGMMRSCSVLCKERHSKPLQTTLSTRILTPTEEGSVAGLLVGVKFLVGEAHLTVTKAVQDKLAIIAAVSMNPLNPLRHRFREILQDAGPSVYKEHIWPDNTAGLSVPVFVY